MAKLFAQSCDAKWSFFFHSSNQGDAGLETWVSRSLKYLLSHHATFLYGQPGRVARCAPTMSVLTSTTSCSLSSLEARVRIPDSWSSDQLGNMVLDSGAFHISKGLHSRCLEVRLSPGPPFARPSRTPAHRGSTTRNSLTVDPERHGGARHSRSAAAHAKYYIDGPTLNRPVVCASSPQAKHLVSSREKHCSRCRPAGGRRYSGRTRPCPRILIHRTV